MTAGERPQPLRATAGNRSSATSGNRSLARASATIVALALTALLPACGSPKRDECRALQTLINATADSVDKAQASPLDPSGLKALADVLEKAATDAEALKLSVPELQKHAKDYAALQRDVAKTARDMAKAGETTDQAAADAANKAMEKIVANEPKLVADINKLCGGN